MSLQPLLHSSLFARLLALILLCASTSIASHIHVHTDSDTEDTHDAHGIYEEQIEHDCFVYQQIQSGDLAQPNFIAPCEISKVNVIDLSSFDYAQIDHLYPPSRAPPTTP